MRSIVLKYHRDSDLKYQPNSNTILQSSFSISKEQTVQLILKQGAPKEAKINWSRRILRYTLYMFALHLFVAGWPGLGLVLVPLRLALRVLCVARFARSSVSSCFLRPPYSFFLVSLPCLVAVSFFFVRAISSYLFPRLEANAYLSSTVFLSLLSLCILLRVASIRVHPDSQIGLRIPGKNRIRSILFY